MSQLPEGAAEKLQALQEKLLAAQKELAKETVQGSAGNGGITITITGEQKCVEVKIDAEFYANNDANVMQEVTKAALNQALEESRRLAANRLSPYSPDLIK